MKKKKIKLECSSCDNVVVLEFKSKDPIAHCPFCGDDAQVADRPERPLEKDFDDHDSYGDDYEDDDDDYEDDSDE